MNASLWLGAAASLIGVLLGGLISLVLNRQQIRAAREQRVEEELRSRLQHSEARRFDAYTNFFTSFRSYRDAIRIFEKQSASKVSIAKVESSADSVYNASALVFMVAENEVTYEACRAGLMAVYFTQRVLHDQRHSPELWTERNTEIAELLREFQVAARRELGVGGIDPSLILHRNSSAKRMTPTAKE